MAQVIVTIKLGQIGRIEQEPIAFGIKAVKISFFSEESKSNLDPLEDILRQIEDVESVETIEVRRALI
ncbi:hypothetical protein J4449_03580 [Candidatus Woesearchaeota archaeon]|nr:hypothetical protein [Candidatus Woesearchaeota archaeon]